MAIINTKKSRYIFDAYREMKVSLEVAIANNEFQTLNEAIKKASKLALLKDTEGSIIDKDVTIYGVKKHHITTPIVFNKKAKLVQIITNNVTTFSSFQAYDCNILNVTINNPLGLYVIHDCEVNDIVINNLGIHETCIYIENSVIKGSIKVNNFIKKTNPITIYICNNHLYNPLTFASADLNEDELQLSIINNQFHTTDLIIKNNTPYLDFKDNIFVDEKSKQLNLQNIAHLKYTGYRPCGVILNPDVKNIPAYTLMEVTNIPQYLGSDDDPPLQTGCEATACAIALSYILNKKITKNEIATLMPKGNPGEDFWTKFIGDIYHDGYGTMSPVGVKAINDYLTIHHLSDKYEVINATNTSLIKLLKIVSTKTPVIAWATMGNESTMYSRKYGSTKWDNMYWPGRDHALVIVGYNLNLDEIYVCDPEENSPNIRTRNLSLFANRFAQLYNQSIIIKLR